MIKLRLPINWKRAILFFQTVFIEVLELPRWDKNTYFLWLNFHRDLRGMEYRHPFCLITKFSTLWFQKKTWAFSFSSILKCHFWSLNMQTLPFEFLQRRLHYLNQGEINFDSRNNHTSFEQNHTCGSDCLKLSKRDFKVFD